MSFKVYSFLSGESCSLESNALVIPHFFSSSTKSPLWCICNNMSQPPTNSPFMKTCGIVGQLVKSLTPETNFYFTFSPQHVHFEILKSFFFDYFTLFLIFIPCLRSSSLSTSWAWYLTPCIRKICTTALLNPHLGSAGTPFIKITTLSSYKKLTTTKIIRNYYEQIL